MSQKIKYSLTDLWKFSDKQIIQILEYFNHQPSSSSLNDRLDAIILSYNNNILKDEDIIYVENNQFDDLFEEHLLNFDILYLIFDNIPMQVFPHFQI